MRPQRAFIPVPFGCLLFLAAFIVLTCPAVARAQLDPAVGNWKLNLAKSKYGPGIAPPKSVVVRIEPAGQGIKVTARTIGADGLVTETHYTAYADGQDYPVTGTRDYDSVSLKHNGSVVEGTRKKKGVVVQTYQRVLSADGKTMTVATTGVTQAGRPVNTVAVFERQ